MSLVVDEHRLYLSDEVRLSAFRRAIERCVTPGSVVLDLASGTGILGLFACQAGASRVYSIEVSGMIELARAVAEANGFGDRVVFLHGMSTEVTLPERVDLIVCDQIGRFGFEAGLLQFGNDARERFLKPGGTTIPSRVDLCIAPVEVPDHFAQVEFWRDRPAGFEFGPARTWAANTGYPILLSEASLLAAPAAGARIELSAPVTDPIAVASRFIVSRGGSLHGIGGWFSAELAPGVTLSNGPTAAERLERRNVFFPIDRVVPVQPGDSVAVDVRIRAAAMMVTWTVEVRRGAEALGRFRHSTLNGMLMCREDLRRMNPHYVPALTPRGVARQTILELCDGKRTLADIEREVFTRHRELFPSLGDASAFVAEVVTRYTR